MGHHASTTYNFTAFTEADLLAAGSGNGDNLGYGDTFTMPGCASVEFSVTDNDSRLSGDSRHNEHANDKSGQHASITQNGQDVGNGGQIYAEGYMWLSDQAGNWYLMIEIEQEGGGDDYFAFHECYGVPPAGAELTVHCGGNISCWEPRFDDLTAGEVKSGPEAADDMITITEDQSIGDASDDAQLNILANDRDAVLATVNGEAPGADLMVTTEGGVTVLASVDAAGNLSFDTAGKFDSLNDGETDSFTLTYTVTGAGGKAATASATIVITGETDAIDAINDVFVVFESEGAGEPGGDGNVLANDVLDPALTTVVEVNGMTGYVGEWITLTSGARFRLNADGAFDFDANGAYDSLNRDERAFETLTYTVRSDGPDQDKVTTTFTGPNGLEADVIVKEVDGDLVVTVSVLTDGGDIGDIRGLFFDVADESLLSGLDATGADITGDKFRADRVDNLGKGANVKGAVVKELGKFDGGVRIGTPGIGKDDVRSTTFILSHATEDLTLDLLSGQDMGLRLTNVGDAGGHRGGSLKLGGVSEFAPAPIEFDTATVAVEIVGENIAPVAMGNDYIVVEDAAPAAIGNVIFDMGGDVGAADSDFEGDALSVKNLIVDGEVFAAGEAISVFSAALNAETKVTVAADGTISFDDLGNFDALSGDETDVISFDYTAHDGFGGEDTATVFVTILGEDEAAAQTEYNILLLVDASDGLADGAEHGLFQFTDPTDLNGDGVANTVLDAELSTVQQFVDQLGALGGLGADVEIGVQTFGASTDPNAADGRNKALADANGNTIFRPGDDLSEVFLGAGLVPEGQPDAGAPVGGEIAWNTAIAGANDFFEFTNDPAGEGEVANLVYILSDSEGAERVTQDDLSLAFEIAELQAEHNAVVDAIIFNDPGAENPFLTSILVATGGNDIELVESQSDLDALLANPLLENLDIV